MRGRTMNLMEIVAERWSCWGCWRSHGVNGIVLCCYGTFSALPCNTTLPKPKPDMMG